MSLSLDLHPLRLGRETRSGAAPSYFLKKMWGCDCTVCIAGGVAQACLGTAPSGTGVRTYDCGACENLLTSLARWTPLLEALASGTRFSSGPVRVWCVLRRPSARCRESEPSKPGIPLCSSAVL